MWIDGESERIEREEKGNRPKKKVPWSVTVRDWFLCNSCHVIFLLFGQHITLSFNLISFMHLNEITNHGVFTIHNHSIICVVQMY